MELQTLELEGKRYVVVEETAYRQLRRNFHRQETDPDLPPFPPVDADGNCHAIEFARASIARDIILDRKQLGLSQQDLAKLAGVRQETLSRLETGKHTATVRVVGKIVRGLKQAAKRKVRLRCEGHREHDTHEPARNGEIR